MGAKYGKFAVSSFFNGSELLFLEKNHEAYLPQADVKKL